MGASTLAYNRKAHTHTYIVDTLVCYMLTGRLVRRAGKLWRMQQQLQCVCLGASHVQERTKDEEDMRTTVPVCLFLAACGCRPICVRFPLPISQINCFALSFSLPPSFPTEDRTHRDQVGTEERVTKKNRKNCNWEIIGRMSRLGEDLLLQTDWLDLRCHWAERCARRKPKKKNCSWEGHSHFPTWRK